MFNKTKAEGFHPIVAGISIKTRVHGEKTLMAEFRIAKGADLPSHLHPHEQTGMLVSGELELKIGDQVFPASSGDTWCIPENVPHSAHAVSDSVVIEVFSPVREDYLKWLS